MKWYWILLIIVLISLAAYGYVLVKKSKEYKAYKVEIEKYNTCAMNIKLYPNNYQYMPNTGIPFPAPEAYQDKVKVFCGENPNPIQLH